MTGSKRDFFKRPSDNENLVGNQGDFHGGTIVNIVVGLLFFALVGAAIWWVIKSLGEAGQQYTGTLIETKYTAETVKCQTNLRAIWQNIQMYSATNGAFPSSKEALKEWSGNYRLFSCPALEGLEYVYIRGQNGDMSSENVLLYEPEPVHDGRCSVLRLGGQIELLTPEEVRQAIARTLAGLR